MYTFFEKLILIRKKYKLISIAHRSLNLLSIIKKIGKFISKIERLMKCRPMLDKSY